MSLKAFYAFLECQNITVSRVRMSVIWSGYTMECQHPQKDSQIVSDANAWGLRRLITKGIRWSCCYG